MPTKKSTEKDESFQVSSQSEESVPGNYTVITYRDRIRLIEMICIDKMQILQAASSLGIKISTAKYILRCFRKYGKVLKKNEYDNPDKQKLDQEVVKLKKRIQEINSHKRKGKLAQKKPKGWAPQNANKKEIKQEQKQNQGEEESKFCFSACPLNQKGGKTEQSSNQSCQGFIFYYFYNPYYFQPLS